MSILISVIIPTHNRANYLAKAIQSVLDQPISKEKYEIIIVDNCSTDSTKEVVERFCCSNIQYIFEPQLGVNIARNTGWRNSRGRYVAYLDDDAIACQGWLNKILEVFETVTPCPGCVGGKVNPIWEGTRPPWLSDWLLHSLAIIDWSDNPHQLLELSQEWLVSANLAFPIDLLKITGGFNPALGRVGRKLLSNDEILLQKEILARGYTCFYHPEIMVSHHIQPTRLEKEWFIRRYYWQGVSDAAIEIIEKSPSRLIRLLSSLIKFLKLLLSPRKILRLVLPQDSPEKFTEKCFALIEVGHITGLLGAASK